VDSKRFYGAEGRLELATTVFKVNLDDLEDFKLFARAKINLGKGTVKHYVSRVRTFLRNRDFVTDKDVQLYVQKKKETRKPDYVSNIISSFKTYFGDYKGLSWMDGYKHPSGLLKMKEDIEPEKVRKFIEAIDDLGIK